MAWRVYYKQDGVTYYTEAYPLRHIAESKVSVLELLSRDLRISDIKMVQENS